MFSPYILEQPHPDRQYDQPPDETEMLFPGDRIFEGLLYYQDRTDSERYFYLPPKPGPAADPQGRPMLSLIVSGETGFLQVDVCWQASSSLLDTLRQHIAQQHPELDPTLIRFCLAPIIVNQVELLLTSGGGDMVLTTSGSSGVPPYNTFLSVALNLEQQNQVKAAVHGHLGILCVRYHISRLVSLDSTVAMERDMQLNRTADVGTWFTGNESDVHVCTV